LADGLLIIGGRGQWWNTGVLIPGCLTGEPRASPTHCEAYTSFDQLREVLTLLTLLMNLLLATPPRVPLDAMR